jgi:hypothetical protein
VPQNILHFLEARLPVWKIASFSMSYFNFFIGHCRPFNPGGRAYTADCSYRLGCLKVLPAQFPATYATRGVREFPALPDGLKALCHGSIFRNTKPHHYKIIVMRPAVFL